MTPETLRYHQDRVLAAVDALLASFERRRDLPLATCDGIVAEVESDAFDGRETLPC